MICPFCEKDNDKVIDSRSAEGGRVIRRRRECVGCARRFTTYERVEHTTRLMVIKKDGSRVPFGRENIARGLAAACGKRPVPEDVKVRIVDRVEEEVHREFDKEVESSEIGRRVMALLREVDEVAYIRFASEHEQFKTLSDFVQEIQQMATRPKGDRKQQSLF
ncbi:MAG: transcriptional repressor NrdR [Phycisphaeraceae bacterium]|nr:transcriptional repressor NrdR [Phycisphaeraceae bacterium]